MGIFRRNQTRKNRAKTQARRNRRARLELLEDRRVLATLAYFASFDELRFVGDAAVDDITIEFSGSTYTITDSNPAETINAAGFVDTNPASNIVEFDTTGNPVRNLRINSSAADDFVTINSFDTASDAGLQIFDIAGQGNDTITINGDVGNIASTSSFDQIVLEAEVINLGTAALSTNNSNVVFRAPTGTSPVVNLIGDVEIFPNGGQLEIDAIVEGPGSLTLTNGGSALIRQDVGGTTPVGAFSLQTTDLIDIGEAGATASISGSSITLDSGSVVTLSDDLTSTSDVSIDGTGIVLADDVTIASAGGGGNTLDLNANVTGSNDLTIDGGTDVVSLVSVQNIGDLDVNGIAVNITDSVVAESILIASAGLITADSLDATNGGITITGNISFANAGGTAQLVSTSVGTTIDGTVEGAGNLLDFRGNGAVNISGFVNNAGALQTILGTFDSVSFDGPVIVSDLTVTATNISLGDNVFALTDSVTLTGAVTVTGDSVIASGFGLGDNVTINGDVDADVANTHSLELRAGGGNAQVFGSIGSTTNFQNFLGSGDVFTTTNIATGSGDLILEGGDVNVSGTLTGTGNVAFRPRLNGGTLEVHNRPIAPVSANTTIDNNALAAIQPGFTSVTFGGSNTGAVIVFGDGFQATEIDFSALGVGVQFIADEIELRERINQGANPITLRAGTEIRLEENGIATGDGDFIIERTAAGPGTLTVGGARGIAAQPAFPWGDIELVVDGNGGNVDFLNEVARIDSLSVDSNTNLVRFSSSTGVILENGGTIDSDVELAGGFIVNNGTLEITGTTTLTGPANFLGGAGVNFLLGDLDAGGSSVQIRHANLAGPGLGNIALGSTNNIDDLLIRPEAASLALGDVVAGGTIQVGSQATSLSGDLTTNNGLLFVQGGPVTLADDVVLTNSSASPNFFTRVDGAIDGAFDLTIESGLGRTILVGAIGAGTALNNVTVNSTGTAVLAVPITVVNNFSWTVGDETNAGADVLIIAGAGVVTAGAQIDLEADSIRNENIGVNLIAPTVNVVENGAP